MSSRADVVRGAQRPRVELLPTAAYTDLADDAVALCDAAGLHLDDWQEHVVRGMLGERLDGRFVAPRVGVVVPRQQGKGVILEARALAGMFLLKEPFIIWTAHELKTAQAAFIRLRSWIDGAPDLAKHVRQYYTGNTENSIVFNDGRVLRFLARTPGSGRGLTASTLILDEAYGLKDVQLAALSPTLSTADNPQTIYASSAGMPDSEVLERIRQQGLDTATKGLAYFEWSAPDDSESDDMDALIASNPGLGVRLSLETVAAQRAEWTDENFRRERLGIWAPIGGASFIPATDWGHCRDDELIAAADELGGVEQNLSDVRLSVDVSPDRSTASISIAGVRPDGSVYVEVVDSGEGVDWISATLAPIWKARSQSPVLVQKGSSAEDLVPELRRSGIAVRAVPLHEYAAACGRMFDAIKKRQVAHSAQEQLDSAMNAARPSYKGDTKFIWKRSHALADITPLVTVTLAANTALRQLRREDVDQSDASSASTTRAGRLIVRRQSMQRPTRSH